MILKSFLCLFATLSFVNQWASASSVVAYTGDGSEKLFIETASGDVAFIKIEASASKWSGKVIKTKKETASAGDRYSFEYFLELSSGKQKRTYTPVVADGETLFQGSSVKKMKLYFPGGPKEGVDMKQDFALSKESQKINLASEYKKAPYSPDVD